MHYRDFGATGLKLSEVCYGSMRFASQDGTHNEKYSAGQRALAKALDMGVNCIHSSYEYGTRWALSEVLKSHPRRHEIHHVIKVAVPDFEDDGRFDASKFRSRIEEALNELHTERISIVQHLVRHNPNTDDRRIPAFQEIREQSSDTFHKLRREGKVVSLVTFPYTPEFAATALGTDVYDGVAAYLNPIETEMLDLFDDLMTSGRGFLCIRPFLGGLLTDRNVRHGRLVNQNTERKGATQVPPQFIQILEQKLGPIPSWTSFAVKFALIHPIVASIVVSLNTEDQVEEVLGAADGSYPSTDVLHLVREIQNSLQ